MIEHRSIADSSKVWHHVHPCTCNRRHEQHYRLYQ